ncbi:MAG: PQQ-like beta-propeller repeat protein [Methanotrichaceae archaeon]|nr:PQQ-like beta-propeller repeat protein [Methanotrichaceae archaeon]
MDNKTTNSIVKIAISLLFLGLIIHPAACDQTQDWPEFHLDASHGGASISSAPHANQTAWISEDLGAQEGSSVSVADGRVFVNCVDRLVCLDQSSGKVLWNASFEATPGICQVWGFSPAYSEGRVFVSGCRTVCLNATDGSVLWSFAPPTGRGAVNGGPAAAEGRVLVSDWDGHHYYCLNEETGDELWNFTVEGDAQSTPAVEGDKVVFSSWEWGMGGKIYCVRLADGSEIWNISTRNSPCGSAALCEGRAFVTTYNFEGDGDVMAVSLQDGSLLWQQPIARTDCTPAVAGGLVYVCGGTDGFSDKATYCFNATDGETVWNTSTEEGIGEWRCSPAYADGLLFVGKTENMNFTALYALNASSGDLVWSYPAGGSAPAIADGTVFSIGGGKVYAIGP